MPALYVHVPFCASVCPYCDFATMAAPPRLHGEWLSTLRREALAWRERPVGEFDWGKSRFDTLYFGGGTPSILDGPVLAGAVEAVSTLLSLHEGIIPHTINVEHTDERIDPRLCIVREQPLKRNIRYALSNSFGFGGHNTSLLFKKYEE